MSGIDVYEPKEDSFLILKHIKNFAENKTVLDLGTGTGILAIEAAKYAKKVYAVDISKKALAVAKQNAKKANAKNITFLRSDLFSAFKQAKRKPRFDLILFNPPYLPAQPSEPKELALQIAGGKHGYELIERFFRDVSFFLNPDGVILLVFSTLTKKHKVDKIIEEHCFIAEELDRQKLFFETIFLYKIIKSRFLKDAEKHGLKQVIYFTKGKRGWIYKANYKGKQVCIKRKIPQSAALKTIENEARYLKLLNRYGIGPRFYFKTKNYLVIEFVDGKPIEEFIKSTDDAELIKKVLFTVFKKCRKMDQLKINKEEMHHPRKHIIVELRKKKPIVTLIDFDRAHKTQKPKNVTQFCQYLISTKMIGLLEEKGIFIDKGVMLHKAREYKHNPTKKNFEQILKEIRFSP